LVIVVDLDRVLSLRKVCVDLSPKFTEVGKTSCSHPNDEVLCLHVIPLNILVFHAGCSWDVFVQIFEFVLNIRFPGNTFLTNINFLIIWSIELKGIVENTLGNKSTRNSFLIIFKRFLLKIELLMLPKIGDGLDWITITELILADPLSIQLCVVSGLYISSMILVEVIELVIHIDWSLDNFIKSC